MMTKSVAMVVQETCRGLLAVLFALEAEGPTPAQVDDALAQIAGLAPGQGQAAVSLRVVHLLMGAVVALDAVGVHVAARALAQQALFELRRLQREAPAHWRGLLVRPPVLVAHGGAVC